MSLESSVVGTKRPLFGRIAIVGVGLIGGSLGLAIKKNKLAQEVIGVVRREAAIADAVQRNVVDKAYTNLRDGIRNADLVILCGPISIIIEHLHVIHRYVKPETVVIDVGSTKLEIVNVAKSYFNKPNSAKFIGCHPMAGSEKKGIEYASADLFYDSICLITDSDSKIFDFWREVGSIPVQMDPGVHDIGVSFSSHVPHLLAFAMFQDYNSENIPVTNPSIRDFVRLSKSDPDIWSDIFLSNSERILFTLGMLQRNLSKWQDAIKNNDKKRIKEFIHIANGKSPWLIWGKTAERKQPDQLDSR